MRMIGISKTTRKLPRVVWATVTCCLVSFLTSCGSNAYEAAAGEVVDSREQVIRGTEKYVYKAFAEMRREKVEVFVTRTGSRQIKITDTHQKTRRVYERKPKLMGGLVGVPVAAVATPFTVFVPGENTWTVYKKFATSKDLKGVQTLPAQYDHKNRVAHRKVENETSPLTRVSLMLKGAPPLEVFTDHSGRVGFNISKFGGYLFKDVPVIVDILVGEARQKCAKLEFNSSDLGVSHTSPRAYYSYPIKVD